MDNRLGIALLSVHAVKVKLHREKTKKVLKYSNEDIRFIR